MFGNIDFVDMLLTFGTPHALVTLTQFYSTNQVKLFEEDQFSRLLVLPLNNQKPYLYQMHLFEWLQSSISHLRPDRVLDTFCLIIRT